MLQTRSYPIGLLVYALELRISPRVLANCRESFLAAHSNKPERLRVARFLVAIFFYDWIDPQDQQTEYIYIYISCTRILSSLIDHALYVDFFLRLYMIQFPPFSVQCFLNIVTRDVDLDLKKKKNISRSNNEFSRQR